MPNFFSLPSSRNSSKTSSRASLFASNMEDPFDNIEPEKEKRPQPESEPESEHNGSLPSFEGEESFHDEDIPYSQRRAMVKHPLGSLLLKICAQNLELCNRLKIKNIDTVGLGECTAKFAESLKLDKAKLSKQIDSSSGKVEENILQKELSFNLLNAAVAAPTNYSEWPVLTTAEKLQSAVKTFPCRSGQRFDGTTKGVSVVEFLNSMNTAQEICQLSQAEFCRMLLKCVSGRVYGLVSECISYQHDVSDIYHSLLTLYDNRLSASTARKQLMSYKASRSDTLMKVQAYILELASRVASSLPEGPSRSSLFNLEANNGLLRCLPPSSTQIVQNTYNSLSARLGRLPTYVELTKSLVRFTESINEDIIMKGQLGAKAAYGTYDANYPRKNYKVFAIEKQYPSHRRKTFGGGMHAQNFARGRGTAENTAFRQKTQVHAVHVEKGVNEKFNRNRPFELKSKGRANDRGMQKKKAYCSLCGATSHNASDVCYKMRNADGRVQEVIPSYYPCTICVKRDGKKLYHPEDYCFRKMQDKSE